MGNSIKNIFDDYDHVTMHGLMLRRLMKLVTCILVYVHTRTILTCIKFAKYHSVYTVNRIRGVNTGANATDKPPRDLRAGSTDVSLRR